MMNAMRIEVGLSAASLAKRGYLEALLYAQVWCMPWSRGACAPMSTCTHS